MLDFLVTSKARRRLLVLLWGEGRSGSVEALAEEAGVGFASAWRELKAMHGLGLASREQEGRAAVYRANADHPNAAAVRALVKPPESRETVSDLRARLRALGAPLVDTGDSGAPVLPGDLEATVVGGVLLAHQDPSVARAMPVCLYRLRDRLSPERLASEARLQGEKDGLGFFLDLTTDLSHDGRFRRWSRPLADGRRTALRDFFPASRSAAERTAARQRTPAAARRWGFLMNMTRETFESTFHRHVVA